MAEKYLDPWHHKRWIYIAKAELAKGNWTLRDKAATVKTNIARHFPGVTNIMQRRGLVCYAHNSCVAGMYMVIQCHQTML